MNIPHLLQKNCNSHYSNNCYNSIIFCFTWLSTIILWFL